MARQIVKESFYILCNRFAFFIPPGIIAAILAVASSVFPQSEVPVYRFIFNFLICLFAEVPCIAVYYGKGPVATIRDRLLSLLLVVTLRCLFLLCAGFVSDYISNVMGEDAGKLVFTLVLLVIRTIIDLFFYFTVIEIIKNDSRTGAATKASLSILSSNKAWNIGLYVRIILFEFAVLLVFVLVIAILIGVLSALAPISLWLIFIPILSSLFAVYLPIRICHYYEAIS